MRRYLASTAWFYAICGLLIAGFPGHLSALGKPHFWLQYVATYAWSFLFFASSFLLFASLRYPLRKRLREVAFIIMASVAGAWTVLILCEFLVTGGEPLRVAVWGYVFTIHLYASRYRRHPEYDDMIAKAQKEIAETYKNFLQSGE